MAEPWDNRTLAEDLLARCVDDWVDPSELLNVVRRSGATEPSDLRDLAVGLLARMLTEGLIVIGDVWDTHIPWDGTPQDVLWRVGCEWAAQEDPYVMPGELFWVDATNAGQAVGEAVLAREAGW